MAIILFIKASTVFRESVFHFLWNKTLTEGRNDSRNTVFALKEKIVKFFSRESDMLFGDSNVSMGIKVRFPSTDLYKKWQTASQFLEKNIKCNVLVFWRILWFFYGNNFHLIENCLYHKNHSLLKILKYREILTHIEILPKVLLKYPRCSSIQIKHPSATIIVEKNLVECWYIAFMYYYIIMPR